MGARARKPERPRRRRPAGQRFLRAVRTAPPIPTRAACATAEQIRADLKLLAPLTRAIRLYSSTGGVELVPGIAAEFGLRVTVGAWIDKDEERNEREIRSVDRARQAPTATSKASSSATKPSTAATRQRARADQEDPAGQARDQRAGDDRRNLERMDRASRTGLGGRLYRRAHPALLGRLLRRADRRPGDLDLRQTALGLSRQAHRHRRVRLAERRL